MPFDKFYWLQYKIYYEKNMKVNLKEKKEGSFL